MGHQLSKRDLIDVRSFGPIGGQIVDDRCVIRHAFVVQEFGHGDGGHDLAEAGDMHPDIGRPALATVLRGFRPVQSTLASAATNRSGTADSREKAQKTQKRTTDKRRFTQTRVADPERCIDCESEALTTPRDGEIFIASGLGMLPKMRPAQKARKNIRLHREQSRHQFVSIPAVTLAPFLPRSQRGGVICAVFLGLEELTLGYGLSVLRIYKGFALI
jgi:hypothetical protein